MAQITTRKRGKTWEYSFEIAPVDGKRKRKSKGGFRTKADALKAGTQAKAEYDNGGIQIEQNNLSYSDWLDSWYNSTVKPHFKPQTSQVYLSIINTHLKPNLGDYRLNSIRPMTLRKFFDKLIEEEYATSTIRGIRRIVNSSFDYALQLNLVSANPCKTIKIRTTEEEKFKEKTVISKETFDSVIGSLTSRNYYFGIPLYIGWFTGARLGEVTALTWDDVDFENKLIRINKSESQAFGELHRTTPKTSTAKRDILIGDTLVKILSDWRKFQNERAEKLKVEKTNRVCTTQYLETVRPYAIGQFCRRISKTLNIDFHFHALRHTQATNLIKYGVPLKEVQARLGHKFVQTTLDIYTHLNASEGVNSVEILEKINVDKP